MFEVKGIPIYTDEVEVLKELRNQVLLQQGKEILRKIKPTGNNIMICCPEHNNGQERNPSCGISTVRIKDKPPGTVHCFACGYVDSLEGMISKCFGHYEDDSYGIAWLQSNFIGDQEAGRPSLIEDTIREVSKPLIDQNKHTPYVTEEELASYRFYHPYMWQRKLTPEIVEKYDVGYQKDFRLETDNEDGTKTFWPPVEVLTFPVKDEKGNCLFVSRRSIYGKTFFLPKMQKPVYGIYELPKDCKEVIVCESVINALTCVSYGRAAVALFGTGDSYQYEQLKKLPVRKYKLALDPDKAGNKGTYKLKWALRDRMVTKYIIPFGKDINDLSREEFESLQEVFL